MEINMNSTNKFFQELNEKIKTAQAQNQPYDHYVRKQIELLQEAHDEFILQAKKEGHNINSSKVGEIEIEQYSAMKALAQNAGLPIEKYDKKIKEIQIRIMGIENYNRFFRKKS